VTKANATVEDRFHFDLNLNCFEFLSDLLPPHYTSPAIQVRLDLRSLGQMEFHEQKTHHVWELEY